MKALYAVRKLDGMPWVMAVGGTATRTETNSAVRNVVRVIPNAQAVLRGVRSVVSFIVSAP